MTIKTFSDGSYLEYSAGAFDEWCVYMVNPAKRFRRPPRDVDYFGFLSREASTFGARKIYDDFVEIYNLTSNELSQDVLAKIDDIALAYGTSSLEFSKIFTILYMGMIAEEKKAGTRLGKRIKRLGVYKLLIEGQSVDDSANFMRGMRWRDIDQLCKERGF